MVLKKLDRAAITSWSPSSESVPKLAMGTVAGALDASFSSNTMLELFDLNLQENGSKMNKIGEVASSARLLSV